MKEKTVKKKTKSNKILSDMDLKDALIKKALGYDVTEVVEEYVEGDSEGEVKLSKKKVTKKNVPPDVTALKMLLENFSQSVREMTDEQLEKEKERLLNLMYQQKNNSKE